MYPDPVFLEGDLLPGQATALATTSRPDLGGGGVLAFRGTLLAPGGDVLVVDGSVLLREGDLAPGTAFTITAIPSLGSYQQVNASGQVASEVATSAPSSQNNCLYRDLELVYQEGQEAPGIPGRFWSDWSYVGIADDGRLGFLGDLTGDSANDIVLMLGGVLLAREGSPIPSTPFAGFAWHSFGEVDWSGSGAVLFEAQTTRPGVGQDSGIFLVDGSGTLHLILEEGVTPIATASGPATMSDVSRIHFHGSGRWAARATLSTGGAVIAGNGLGAPDLIAHSGDPIPSLPGATLSSITGASINSAGDVLFLAFINGATGVTEGLFLHSAGNWDLLLADNGPVIGVPGATLTDMAVDNLLLGDAGEVYFEGDLTIPVSGSAPDVRDGIFEVRSPLAPAVENLTCTMGPDSIAVSWDPAVGIAYSAFRVVLDGVEQVPDLPPSQTTFTVGPFTVPASHTICVLGLAAGETSFPTCCNQPYVPPADHLQCSAGPQAIPDAGTIQSVLAVSASFPLSDAYVSLDIVHPNTADLVVTLTSPQSTTITLLLHDGGTSDDVHAVYSDAGVFGAENQNLLLRPVQGRFLDFRCEDVQGNWTLDLTDDTATNEGELVSWCLGLYEEQSPALNCCASPSDLGATSFGLCAAGTIHITWTNHDSYHGLELVRKVNGGAETIIPLPGDATDHLDTAVPAGSILYTLRYVCAPGGDAFFADSQGVNHDPTEVPAVTQLTCSSSFPVDEVVLSWETNDVPYLTLSLMRDGFFLANVTGQSSYIDTSPLYGSTFYSILAGCSVDFEQTECSVTHDPPPSPEFVRGNCNGTDSVVDIADAVYVLGVLFPPGGGPSVTPGCLDACDANDDGMLDIGDAVRLLAALFGSPTVPLPPPGPESGCGTDATLDSMSCETATPGC